MKGQNVRQLYESLGSKGFVYKMSEAIKAGEIGPRDFSLREMYIGCCGEAAFNDLGRRFSNMGGNPHAAPELYKMHDEKTDSKFTKLDESTNWVSQPNEVLQETGGAVDVSAFYAITGQIAFNAIGKGWENAEFVGERIFKNYPTPFSGEKIPWISNLFGPTPGDSDIHPLMPYPETTIGPRYVTSPRTFKKGGILSLGMEFILFDRTGQALQGFEKLGQGIRYDKEYMQLRVFFGYNPVGPLNTLASGQYAYNLNNTSYQTWNVSGTVPSYTNAQVSTPLTDFTSYQAVMYLRSKILDPDTQRPIAMGPPKDLFVMPQQVFTAKRVLHATGYQTIFPGYSATVQNPPGNVKLDSANPVDWGINLLSSPIAYQILNQASVPPVGSGNAASPLGNPTAVNAYWVAGDFQESFWYAENFPWRTEQAAPANIRQFEQDISMRWKLSEMGVPFVYDPRYCVFSCNS